MFILTTDLKDSEYVQVQRQWVAYERYLASQKERLTTSAYEFATADWHYNPQDHRCPHDSWVESLIVTEHSAAS